MFVYTLDNNLLNRYFKYFIPIFGFRQSGFEYLFIFYSPDG